MAKERNVTRTVIESKKYNVYKMEGLQLVLLDTIEEKGKISEKELATKHNVDKVILDLVEEKKVTYGMSVTDFMAHAIIIEDTATAEKTEKAEKAEKAETTTTEKVEKTK